MSPEYKPLLVVLGGGSVAVPLTLGLAFGWPTWLWGSLIVVLLIVTAMVGRHHYEQGRWRERYDHQWAEQSERSAHPQRLVPDIRLASAEADYKFLFSGTVCWCSIHTAAGISPAYQGDLAVREILARAHDITATRQPDDYVIVQHELAVALGTQLPADQSGQVQAWAVDIALTISDEDAELLKKRSELRKQKQVWEHERDFERNMRTYLGQEVLTSPASAVVWWLARHTDEIREAVPLIGDLRQLVAAANNTDVHEQFRMDHAISLVNELFPDPVDPQRAQFADDLVKIIDSHRVGHACVARLRDTFELDSSDGPVLADLSAPSDPAPVPAKPHEFDLR
jgi:hypothetical protein